MCQHARSAHRHRLDLKCCISKYSSASRRTILLVRRRLDADGLGREMDFSKKVGEAGNKCKCRSGKENPEQHLEVKLEQDFEKKRGNDGTHQQCRECTRSDGGAGQVSATLQARQFSAQAARDICRCNGGRFGDMSAAINDARQAPGHHVQHAGDAGQQKYGGERQLNGVSHVVKVDGRAGHVTSFSRAIEIIRFPTENVLSGSITTLVECLKLLSVTLPGHGIRNG